MKPDFDMAQWRPLQASAGFLHTVGPIEWREVGDVFSMRFKVAAQHCNPVGSCHGGMLATFADVVLGFGVGHAAGTGAFMPTIGLTCEFLAPAPLGVWIFGSAEVVRRGRRIGVARCLLDSDAGGPVLHASGTFKMDRPVRPDFKHNDYLFPR
jgi:uncharacterized protein (TIGR00369 family)